MTTWELLATARFKAFALLCAACIVLVCFATAVYQFRPVDAEPHVELVDMEMRKKIRDFACVVKTGFYIKNFEVFDMQQDRFVFGAIVWFEFNTDEVSPQLLESFSFINGKILEKSPGDISVDNDRMTIKYDVRVETKSQLSYHRFPFDDHRVVFLMTNNFVTPEELYFTVDNANFGISDSVFTASWIMLDKDTSWGYLNLGLDETDSSKTVHRPVVTYSINFSRGGVRDMVIIFIPLFVSFLFALFAFFSSISNLIDRSRLSVGAVTAMLSYRFIIDRMMPSVGYFTTTDAIYTVLLILSLFSFVSQVGFGLYARYGKGIVTSDEVWLQKVNDLAYLSALCALICCMAYILVW